MKTYSSFKLKKEFKRVAASFTDKHERGQFIRRCIEAQLGEESAKRTPMKMRDKE